MELEVSLVGRKVNLEGVEDLVEGLEAWEELVGI